MAWVQNLMIKLPLNRLYESYYEFHSMITIVWVIKSKFSKRILNALLNPFLSDSTFSTTNCTNNERDIQYIEFNKNKKKRLLNVVKLTESDVTHLFFWLKNLMVTWAVFALSKFEYSIWCQVIKETQTTCSNFFLFEKLKYTCTQEFYNNKKNIQTFSLWNSFIETKVRTY